MSNLQTRLMAAKNGKTPTIKDVPSLKFWLKAEEKSNSSGIFDSVSNIKIPGSAIRLNNGKGISFQSTGGSFSKVEISDTLPAIGSNDFIFISSSNIGGVGSIVIGDTSGSHIRLGTAFGNTINDGVNPNYSAGSFVNDNNPHSVILSSDVDSASGLNAYQGTLTSISSDDLTTPQLASITLDQFSTIFVTELYSVMLFVFSTPLTAAEWQYVKAESLWMMDQAVNGSKVLSPAMMVFK